MGLGLPGSPSIRVTHPVAPKGQFMQSKFESTSCRRVPMSTLSAPPLRCGLPRPRRGSPREGPGREGHQGLPAHGWRSGPRTSASALHDTRCGANGNPSSDYQNQPNGTSNYDCTWRDGNGPNPSVAPRHVSAASMSVVVHVRMCLRNDLASSTWLMHTTTSARVQKTILANVLIHACSRRLCSWETGSDADRNVRPHRKA